jgi:hypothetical protein
MVPLSKDAVSGSAVLSAQATVYIQVGEHDKGIDRLGYLLAIPGFASVRKLKRSLFDEPVREHPRFKALIAKRVANRLLAAMILVLAVCPQLHAQDVLSFYPVFSERDALLLPEAEGSWVTNDFWYDTLSVRKAGDNFYAVRLSTRDGMSHYEGVFTRVGDHMLLDLRPVLDGSIGGPDYLQHLLQVHSCIRVKLDKDTLRLGLLKYRWFYENVIAGDAAVGYLLSGSRLILTLPTNEFRTFLADHVDEPGFLEDDLSFRRVQAQEQIDSATGRSPSIGSGQTTVETDQASSQRRCMPSFPYKDGWLGGDGGLSVPIGPAKTLWLFGDTFVGKKDQTTRSGSRMVTTIGVSECRPDKTVDMQYYWRNMYTDKPDHFFQSHTDRYRYWQIDAFMYNNSLYVVMSKIEPQPGSSPDNIFNWSAVGMALAKVADPNATRPDQWKVDLFPWSHVVDATLYDGGFAEDGRYVYLFMVKERRYNYLVRLPLDYIESPEGHMEYFSRDEVWKPGSDSADAKILLDDQLISRVVYHPESKRWLMAYGPHFGGTSIYYRAASEITGPWSDRRTLYECPELIQGTPTYEVDNYCYCARVHAQFFDEDSGKLLITYTCNSKKLSKLIENMTINVPQVVVIPVPR